MRSACEKGENGVKYVVLQWRACPCFVGDEYVHPLQGVSGVDAPKALRFFC